MTRMQFTGDDNNGCNSRSSSIKKSARTRRSVPSSFHSRRRPRVWMSTTIYETIINTSCSLAIARSTTTTILNDLVTQR
ncbi:hypothetical protein Hypma_014559 [Hypsizygus marmoreus]|uniref:Uncharacterized protein n=1 Tax=Hypsizygus marmoreus TaxID=39966 RepID=A0A369JAH2_HYPMA|nr:hypothetical protein Hypma_014559 [Hypsizygus marmoreus]